jgi:hypothetical protein
MLACSMAARIVHGGSLKGLPDCAADPVAQIGVGFVAGMFTRIDRLRPEDGRWLSVMEGQMAGYAGIEAQSVPPDHVHHEERERADLRETRATD